VGFVEIAMKKKSQTHEGQPRHMVVGLTAYKVVIRSRILKIRGGRSLRAPFIKPQFKKGKGHRSDAIKRWFLKDE
jgi:hypothetical protein